MTLRPLIASAILFAATQIQAADSEFVGKYGQPKDVHEDWFDSNPVWLAGYDHHDHATEGCSDESFTGGPVIMAQYLGDDGFDANAWCQ